MGGLHRGVGFAMSALLACIAVGFHQTYFSLSFEALAALPGAVHFHFAAALLWTVLLIAQPLLLRSGRVAEHRFLGRASYAVFPTMLLSAAVLALSVWKRRDWPILFATSADFILLIVFYGLAIKNVRRVALHARYMLATGLVLLDPTLGRAASSFFGLPLAWGNHLPFLVTDLLLLALIFFDTRRNGGWTDNPGLRAWALVLSCFLAYQAAVYTLMPA